MIASRFFSAVLVGLLAFSSLDADAARRLGGGGSVGRQSGNVTQREAVRPQAPANQNAQQAQPSQAARPATPAAAAAPKRPWGAMLGGLAAGLGLAWLASSLGLGAQFGQFILIALLALGVMLVVGAIMRARRGAATATSNGASRSPFAFQGAGAGPADVAQAPTGYNADKVGNDASARPWERSSMAFDTARVQPQAPASSGGLNIGAALAGGTAATGTVTGADGLAGSQNWGVPAGFDAEGFLVSAKRNFVTLQDAWDRSDITSLRAMMTDPMLAEIRAQLAERESQAGGQPNRTEVVVLEARLLGIEELADEYLASVEFSGMIREDASAGPSPFREVWNMTKTRDGRTGWLVAGVQALQ